MDQSYEGKTSHDGVFVRPPQVAVAATEFATSWACPWTATRNSMLTDHDLDLLRHVNCSYLSADQVPTLLDLKRHAQSLSILIRKLSVSTSFGIPDADNSGDIDAADPHALRFAENEAFDWLNDLSKPYANEDPSHHVPLWTIKNHVRTESDDSGPRYHCPLAEAQDFGPLLDRQHSGIRRPHLTHHALTMHANECLEILDHEFGASGGIMGLLPTDKLDDADEMAGAENTLLGQWLLHQQHLIGGMHELEISYANALDLLAGEAVAPAQILHKTPFADRVSGRNLVYPQDKFVLANTGADVLDKIHDILDEQESAIQKSDAKHRARGVMGDRMWRAGANSIDQSKGLVYKDFTSRLYRIKGQGRDAAIFILPAYEEHDGVVATRELEKRPTIVTCVQPQMPVRVSEWERKYRIRLEKVRELEAENHELARERDVLKARLNTLEGEEVTGA